ERSGFSYVRTKLIRNDGPDTGDAWTFTDTEAPLDTTSHAQSAWGDMDGDGDLDLMLANVTIWQPGNNLSLFRNDDGALVRVATGLAHIRYGSADWNDADGDGDLDIVIVGNLDRPDGTGETVVRVLYDAGDGTFTPVEVITAFEDGWLDFGAVSWADYDGDGDVDLLVAGMAFGEDNLEGRSSVYVNDGGTFVLATDLPAPLDGQAGGAFTWFDLDGDGDLDHFVAGAYYVPGGNGLVEARAQLFRNDAPAANGPPSAPSALQATPGPDGVALSWAPAADDTTPSASLTYALHVRPVGAQAPGAHPLPEAGNVSFNTDWTVRGLPDGSYDWEVRALDNAYAAGPVAAGTFVVGTTAAESESVGTAAALQTPHPNPARGRSRFTLTLAEAQAVTIAVFDGLGRRVAVLHEGPLPAGEHALALDGAGLPAGAYVVRATGETFTAARRVTLLR
ncbi:MAG: FG-GAP-like repeat-containing protein, partial [Rhodothermales bacterium]|nr:FG-GAP-like repeat-containing protein [Rhodothermales bacterium]